LDARVIILGGCWPTLLKKAKFAERHNPADCYAFVRHPIYTGLLLAFMGSALALAEFRGILAVAIVSWSLWRKLRNEERWMHQHFGDSYEKYAQRVAALVPFVL